MPIESAADFNSYVDSQIGGVSATFFEVQNSLWDQRNGLIDTWFDIDSVNIKTRLEISSTENFTSKQLCTYNKSGKKVELNFSIHSEDSEFPSTVVSTANYDLTGKMVSFFNKAAYDSDELEPSEKLIFEYEYYDDEG